MTEESIAWLQSADGRALLVTIHLGGLLFALSAAIFGYAIKARLLYGRGPRPGRFLTDALHGIIVMGLVVLWLTGGALMFGQITLADVPQSMILKLSVVALLSLSVWAEHAMVRPWILSGRRPLAASLGWAQLFATSVIGAVSISCWVLLAAGSFLPALQALPLEQAFALIGLVVAGLAAVGLVLASILRARQEKTAPRPGRKRRLRAGNAQPVAVAPAPVQHRQPLSQPPVSQAATPQFVSPRPGFAEAQRSGTWMPRSLPPETVATASRSSLAGGVRQPALLAQNAAPPPAAALEQQVPQHNDLDEQQLRDKLTREWLRCTPSRPTSPPRPLSQPRPASQAWHASNAEPDDRLLHDWLRRPPS